MNLTCTDCGHTFQIDKAKIPSPTFNVKCPNCKKVFQATVQAQADPVKSSPPGQLKPDMDATVTKQMEDVRKDILLSLASLIGHPPQTVQTSTAYSEKRALVCESDSAVAQQIVLVLQRLGYAVHTSSQISDALGRLDGNFYDVITTDFLFPDDSDGVQKLLARVNGRKIDERRKVFVVLISDQVKTLPAQSAFFHGVNITVHKSDLRNLERLVQEGIRSFSDLYATYYRMVEEVTERL